MLISRMVEDFGNSINQAMIDGHYIEMPSSISEISKEDAKGLFSDSVDEDSLIDQLVIRIDDRYFKVGSKAQQDLSGNEHIFKLHDKTSSITVYATWLSGIVYYHAKKHPIERFGSDEVTIKYFSTLLPIWLLKRAKDFEEMLRKMEERFIGAHEVELLTPEFERTLHIRVDESKCWVEGEMARWALRYDLELNKLDSAARYEDCVGVITDLGGQTEDVVKLRPGLRKPSSSEDFQSFTDQSFLRTLEDLRIQKLMTHFKDVRSLEEFILKNIKKKKFIYVDPVSHEETDFTPVIEPALKKYIRIATDFSIQKAFTFYPGQKVVWIWIGGISQLLEEYLAEVITEKYGSEILDTNHVFPNDARKLNLYALEIVAKHITVGGNHDTKETRAI